MEAARNEGRSLRIVLITGMSGAGKTVALKTLEDLEYFCIDNLPSTLLDPLVHLLEQNPEISKVALGMDGRDRRFPVEAEGILQTLSERGHTVVLLFLDASEEVLIRRFAETRRPHPFARRSSIEVGVAREKEALRPLRALATHLLDTSSYNVHELRAAVIATLEKDPTVPLNVMLISFGFKNGIPLEAAFVFDVRYLPNPYFVPGLRDKVGTDPEVSKYVLSSPDARRVIQGIVQVIKTVLPLCRKEGRSSLMVAVGCTGGQHRSVAIVEEVGAILKADGEQLSIAHRDLRSVETRTLNP